MNIDIKYQSLNTAQHDYDCVDGLLHHAHDLSLKENGLSPMRRYASVAHFDNERLLAFHIGGGYKHGLFINSGGQISYSVVHEDGGFGERHVIKGAIGVYQATSVHPIGNTLSFINGYGVAIFYIIYRDGDYHYLGDRFPEVNMHFGLRLKKVYSPSTLDFAAPRGRSSVEEMKDYRLKLEAQCNHVVWGVMGENRFSHPFLVRYALRLYDG